mgnify:CR=1 FL=1
MKLNFRASTKELEFDRVEMDGVKRNFFIGIEVCSFLFVSFLMGK